MRILRDPTSGRVKRGDAGAILRAVAGEAAQCPCCGGGGTPGCVCPGNGDIALPPCCCLADTDPDYCGDQPELCSSICDSASTPCYCQDGATRRPDCCCRPFSDADSCADNAAVCYDPCTPDSMCGEPCENYTCDGAPCCYSTGTQYTISGYYRIKTCECSAARVDDVTAWGSATYSSGSTKISQSGSITWIMKRLFSGSYVTTCTVSGFLSVGGSAGGCSGPIFTVLAPSRSACPSCYTNGPNPSAGTCASEGFGTFSTSTPNFGCGNNIGAEQLSCAPDCSGDTGTFSEGTYESGCRHSAYSSSASGGKCFPVCGTRAWTEERRCGVFLSGGQCASGALSMGAMANPAYGVLPSGLLTVMPTLAMVDGGDRCPLCKRRGWDGRWRAIEGPGGLRSTSTGRCRVRYIEPDGGAGSAHRARGVDVVAPKRSRGLGDTVAKAIDRVSGGRITKTEGCGCQKRQEWLNRVVPYGRRKEDRE